MVYENLCEDNGKQEKEGGEFSKVIETGGDVEGVIS